MVVALYVTAIVVFCGLIGFYFWWSKRKRNKKMNKFKSEKSNSAKSAGVGSIEEDLERVQNEILSEEKKLEAELEEFSFDEKSAGEPSDFVPKFSFHDESDDFKEKEDDEYERKMNSYEKFLQEEQQEFDFDDAFSQEDRADIDSLMDFDFEQLKGKTREEVEEIIKDLSPSVQDFILNDIFDRKINED